MEKENPKKPSKREQKNAKTILEATMTQELASNVSSRRDKKQTRTRKHKQTISKSGTAANGQARNKRKPKRCLNNLRDFLPDGGYWAIKEPRRTGVYARF